MSSPRRYDPLVGSLLDGRYRVVSFLAQGGMGHVYVAEEVRLRRRCALKVLHPHQSHDPSHVERFLREAQTMAQFKHPNIVDIFAFGEEPSGLVFFAMELLEGEDLDARLKARAERPFTTRDCCAWAIQAARAVGVVHAAGLIHRDLKASNIFLARRHDGEEFIKLLDFGIARREEGSELTGTGISLGTPSYMAPEQFQGGVELDRRVDIYAFGVVLYRLLTGRLPFTGDAFQLAVKHNKMRPPSPSKVAPDAAISKRLEAVVLKCMAKLPANRYSAMQEVEDALVTVLREDALRPGFAVARAPTREPQVVSASAAAMQRESGTPPAMASLTGPTVAGAIAAPLARRIHIGLAAGMFGMLILVAVALMRRGLGSPPGGEPSVLTGPDVQARVLAEDHEAGAVTPVRAVPFAPTNPATPGLADLPTVAPTPSRSTAPSVRYAAKERGPVPASKGPLGESTPDASNDPRTQLQAKASACRRKFKAVGGPKILVSYWVGNDGKAHEAAAAADDALGACLAAAVMTTQFEPKLELSREISL